MEKEKTAIFVDFDDTLFNVSALKEKIIEQLEKKLTIPENRYFETYEQAKITGDYILETHCQLIAQKHLEKLSTRNLTKLLASQIREVIIETLRIYAPEFIYSDVELFFKKLNAADNKIDVYILSRGDVFYQSLKIKYSGIENLLPISTLLPHRTIVTQDSKGEIIASLSQFYKSLIVIDDRIEQLLNSASEIKNLNTNFPATYLWIRRDNKFSELNNGNMIKVKSLENTAELIKKEIGKYD